MTVRLLAGDCLEMLATLDADSVSAVVTDPPAGISFMGRGWDGDKGGRRQWVAWMTEVFTEVYRVLKPGAHGLVWALPRTSHWTAWALEDAGFEVRDCIYHLFGSGFPKSLNVSKAIDKMRKDDVTPVCRFLAAHMGAFRITDIVKAMGFDGNGDHGVSAWFREDHVSPRCPTWDQWLALKALLGFGDEMDAETWRLNGRKGQPGEAWYERPLLEASRPGMGTSWDDGSGTKWNGASARGGEAITDAARQWSGWGTALKPAAECWWLIRKPLAEKTVAANVLAHGTGALNVDACRLGTVEDDDTRRVRSGGFSSSPIYGSAPHPIPSGGNIGRWPANCVFSHSESCVEVGTKRVKGTGPGTGGGFKTGKYSGVAGNGEYTGTAFPGYADADGTETVTAWDCSASPECAVRLLDEQSGERAVSGSAKNGRPSTALIEGGYGGWAGKHQGALHNDAGGASRFFYCAKASSAERRPYNDHPTVKPLALMQWLVRLVTPPGGTVLDPFCGSGSTLIAADREGFDCLGIDSDPHAIEIARRRLTDDAGPLLAPLVEAGAPAADARRAR